jgi:hypothetical protein
MFILLYEYSAAYGVFNVKNMWIGNISDHIETK